MFYCFVLLSRENTRKITNITDIAFFSNFHFSDIFPGVSRRINFTDQNFCDILPRLYFVKKKEKTIRENREI